ncbi:MAG: hypothetical protein RL199_426 [Pseudomonadota bacterium]
MASTESLEPQPEDFETSAVPDEERVRLKAGVRAVLGAEGLIARRVPGYEERTSQLAMSEAVVDALVDRGPVVIEAGTGTGKTLAYLVPAILSGRKVVVSTATKALQEQLVEKDLPLLRGLGLSFSWALMKGRSNYLCLLRQEEFDAAPVFVSRAERDQYVELRAWAKETKTGDRAEVELPEPYLAWRDVSSTAETCVGQECPRYQDCHVVRMRQTAQEADVVVVNHHLYFADLALKRSSPGRVGVEVVPRHEAVVFDEAHNLEEVATEFFGAQSSNWRFFDLCRDIDRASKSRDAWPGERLGRLTSQLGKSTEAFFAAVAAKAPADSSRGPSPAPATAPVRKGGADEPLPLFGKPKPGETGEGEEGDVLARSVVLAPQAAADLEHRREARWTLEPGMLDDLGPLRDELSADVQAVCDLFDDVGADDAEAVGFKRRGEELKAALGELTSMAGAGLVFWAEVRGRGVVLRSSPVDVASQMRDGLFAEERAVVLTSATLATGSETTFFQRRIGLHFGKGAEGAAPSLVLPSPFDYERQAALYLPRHLPDPKDPSYVDTAVKEVAALIALAQGRTFVLFTSFKVMREVHGRLAHRIPYRVLMQGERPKGVLLKAFREEPSVLFATASFWEGVDVPGDALSMVIIDKLPFASPADPLVSARLKSIEDRGGSSFGEYQLPSAAITLKQGFGRLIRTRSDRGAVAILDARLWTKGYGSYFRKSLPTCPTFGAFTDLKAWWSRTMARPVG